MPVLHTVGIDPGLVHTGCVRILIEPDVRQVTTEYQVVDGIDARLVSDWVSPVLPEWGYPQVFIEKYRPRSSFGTDERMVKGEGELKRAMPGAKLLNNTDVKNVVPQWLLGSLGLWSYKMSTHHQDLRSAARIAVLGMLRDKAGNKVLADIVKAGLDGAPWNVVSQ